MNCLMDLRQSETMQYRRYSTAWRNYLPFFRPFLAVSSRMASVKPSIELAKSRYGGTHINFSFVPVGPQ